MNTNKLKRGAAASIQLVPGSVCGGDYVFTSSIYPVDGAGQAIGVDRGPIQDMGNEELPQPVSSVLLIIIILFQDFPTARVTWYLCTPTGEVSWQNCSSAYNYQRQWIN